MLRELREETKIAVPPGMLRGSIVAQRVFDDPNRSSRGRTITHGFLIHLKNEMALPGLRSRKPAKAELPPIEAADDAEKAQWWALADIKREMMFEDHYDIILARRVQAAGHRPRQGQQARPFRAAGDAERLPDRCGGCRAG